MIYHLTYDQLFTWLGYDNLDPFLDRGEMNTSALIDTIRNSNMVNQSDLVPVYKWLPMEERLDIILERERIELEQRNGIPDEIAQDNWDQFKARLTASGKPVQTTFKG